MLLTTTKFIGTVMPALDEHLLTAKGTDGTQSGTTTTQARRKGSNQCAQTTCVLLLALLAVLGVGAWLSTQPPANQQQALTVVWIEADGTATESTHQCGQASESVWPATGSRLPVGLQQLLALGQQPEQTAAPRYSHYIHFNPGTRSPMRRQQVDLTAALQKCLGKESATKYRPQVRHQLLVAGIEAAGVKLAQDFSISTSSNEGKTEYRVAAVVNIDDTMQQKYRWLERGVGFPVSLPVLTVFRDEATWRAPGVLAVSLYHDLIAPRHWDPVAKRTVTVRSALDEGQSLQQSRLQWTRLSVSTVQVDSSNSTLHTADPNVRMATLIRDFVSVAARRTRLSAQLPLSEALLTTKALVKPLLDALLLDSAAALQPHCGLVNDENPGSVAAYLPCSMGSTWVEWVVSTTMLADSAYGRGDGLARRGEKLTVVDEFHQAWIHFPLHFPEAVERRCGADQPRNESTRQCPLHTTAVSHQLPNDAGPPTDLIFAANSDEGRRRKNMQQTWVSAFETRAKLRSRQLAHVAAGVVKPSFDVLDGDERYCASMNAYAQLYAKYRIGALTAIEVDQHSAAFSALDAVVAAKWSQLFQELAAAGSNWSSSATPTPDTLSPWADLDGNEQLQLAVQTLLSARHGRSGVHMVFPPDLNLINGGRWILEPMRPWLSAPRGKPAVVEARSHGMKFPADFFIGDVAGIHYCKLVGVSAAAEWLYAAVRP